MKHLFLLISLLLSTSAFAQIVIVDGCNASGYNINGPFYLTGTDATGRNTYEANFTMDPNCMGYCNPQRIAFSYDRWSIRLGGALQLAYNLNATSPNPPESGWVKAEYSSCPSPPTISFPATAESKSCTDCLWSDPNTWVTGMVPTANSHVIINGNVQMDVDVTSLNLTVNHGTSLTGVSTHSLTVKGKLDNYGSLNIFELKLQGYIIPQVIDGTNMDIQKLTIDNVGGVTLTGSLAVLIDGGSTSNNVTLVNGFINLGNYDLTCHGITRTYTNNNSRIITNGTGKLVYLVPGGTINKEFPVALSKSINLAYENYTPVTIMGVANSGTSKPVAVSVRVGSFDPSHTIPDDTRNIAAEWSLFSDHETIEQPFSIKFGWPAQASIMPAGFNITNIYVKRWNGSDWENKTGPKWYEPYTGPGYGVTAEGVTEFSSWGVFDSETVLPVKLVEFTGTLERNSAILSWSTSEETNSDRFEVEHSLDGKTWQKIGEVQAKGASAIREHYTYNHTNLQTGSNYYRLKMIDQDGSYALSRIIALRQAIDETQFLYPNPTDEKVFLNLSVETLSKVTIMKTDGKIMLQRSNIEDGISVKTLAAGIYLWQIESRDGKVQSGKFLITR